MKKQVLLIIDGPMGGGKSSVADILKSKLSGMFFTGLDRVKWFVAGFSRSKEENIAVAHIVENMAETALKEGLNVCVEQGFMKEEYVLPFFEIGKRQNVKVLMYQIEAPKEVLLERLSSRPTPASAKEPVSLERIEKNLENYFANKYKQATVIDSSDKTPEVISEIILADLNMELESN